MTAVCGICPHACSLGDGQTGFCGARSNRNGVITLDSYGLVCALALDPIEKKPLSRFHPGGKILSVGTFGCNMRCPFCQNHDLVTADESAARRISPAELSRIALGLKSEGNIGVAYTYNEPLVGYEYVLDCATGVRALNMKNVLVTNGYINRQPLIKLLPLIDAMNIDLKGFTREYYEYLGGDLETVKRTIELSAAACHVEVTTLIVPGKNDGEAEMDEMCKWLSGIDRSIPLHISRFFPRHEMTSASPTPVSKVYALAEIARRRLNYAYTGNC